MTRRAVFIYNRAGADRENQTLLSFAMSLQDGGSPPLQSDWLLEVQLSDVNDNIPSFSEERYGVSLAENVTHGTVILKVSTSYPSYERGLWNACRYQLLMKIKERMGHLDIAYWKLHLAMQLHSFL